MFSKEFLNKFPPPNFLDPGFTGIVFSDSNIRVLSLNRGNLHPELFLELPLPDGAIVSGVIKQEEQVLGALEGVRDKIRNQFVKFAVPDEISYVFTASVAISKGKDSYEPVSFILEENVPLPLSDTSFDFTPIKIEKGAEGSKVKVVTTAVSSSIIESYVTLLRKVSLEPIHCINESQSIARSILPKGVAENFAIIYVHRDIVGIYMTEGQVVEFSSIIQIPPNSSPELFTSFVTAEFKKSLEYWKGKVGKVQVANCFLCGKHDRCKLILDNADKIPEVALSYGNVWGNAFSLDQYIPDISFEDSLRFAGAIGLFV